MMGYKTVTLSRCKIHNLTFPLLSMMEASGAKNHAEEVKKVLADAQERQIEISYDGSWTMDPELRNDKAESEYLKDLMTGIYTQYHSHFRIPEILGLGLLRFKTEQYFQNIGFELIHKGGQVLPSVEMKSLQNEPVILMHLKAFSEEALAKSQEFKPIWDNRIEISDPLAPNRFGSKKKAA